MSGSRHPSHSGPGYETSDFAFTRVLWLIPGSMLLLAAFVLVGWFWSTAALSREMNRKVEIGAPGNTEQLRALRAHEDSVLGGYMWTNAEKTAARIPVQRAMEILIREGAATAVTPNK